MMISPESFLDNFKDKNYKELLEEKQKLLKEINNFESKLLNPNKNDDSLNEIIMDPAFEVIYQCNLLYLAKLCELLAKKYNQEYIQGGYEND